MGTVWAKIVEAFFKAIEAVGNAVTARTKPEGIQVSEHELKKPRLESREMQKHLRNAKAYLSFHKREEIDLYVEYAYDNLEPDDKEELKKLLHQAFPKHK